MTEAAAELPDVDTLSLFYGTTDDAIPEGADEELAVTEEGLSEDEDLKQGTESDDDGDNDDTENEEEELLYLDLDGKEVALDDVRTWRDGHLMKADYSRKTMKLAEESKAVAAQREELYAELSEVANLKAEMQALISEDSEVDWDELREEDPDEYDELKKRADKRKAVAAKAKSAPAVKPMSQDELLEEQRLLFAANPGWLDDKDNPTAEMEADKALINAYWKDNGFTAQETAGMSRTRYIQACLKAAKFDELTAKGSKLAKKAKAATLVTKPKGQVGKLKEKDIPPEDLFYKPVTE